MHALQIADLVREFRGLLDDRQDQDRIENQRGTQL